MDKRECKDAREFGNIFRAGIKLRGGSSWDWHRDIRPWMADVLNGAKFGDPSYDWTAGAADGLAAEFISESSTW